MPAELRMTTTVVIVLSAFLEDVRAQRYAMELMRTTGLSSGTVYQALARLERNGWLTSAMEDIDPAVAGRPPRRYFLLHPEAVARARIEVAALRQKLHVPAKAPSRRRPGIAGA